VALVTADHAKRDLMGQSKTWEAAARCYGSPVEMG
jgi:hypothetical protein